MNRSVIIEFQKANERVMKVEIAGFGMQWQALEEDVGFSGIRNLPGTSPRIQSIPVKRVLEHRAAAAAIFE